MLTSVNRSFPRFSLRLTARSTDGAFYAGKTFGKTLHGHGAIQTMLSEMAIGVETARFVLLSSSYLPPLLTSSLTATPSGAVPAPKTLTTLARLTSPQLRRHMPVKSPSATPIRRCRYSVERDTTLSTRWRSCACSSVFNYGESRRTDGLLRVQFPRQQDLPALRGTSAVFVVSMARA